MSIIFCVICVSSNCCLLLNGLKASIYNLLRNIRLTIQFSEDPSLVAKFMHKHYSRDHQIHAFLKVHVTDHIQWPNSFINELKL